MAAGRIGGITGPVLGGLLIGAGAGAPAVFGVAAAGLCAAAAPLLPAHQGRYWKSCGPVSARSCAASWPGGAPNSRRYSRLNCEGLS
jgi:hypothetical protein